MSPLLGLPLIALLGLIFAVPGAMAQVHTRSQAAAPLSSALDAGTTVSGVTSVGKASLHSIIALKGDVVELTLRAPGALELAVYGPEGEPVARFSGEGIASGRMTATADGEFWLAVIAEPESRYQVSLRRVVAARVRPPVDARWGPYPYLAGQAARAEPSARPTDMSWHWEVPGEVLVERAYEPATGSVVYTACIRRSESPPHLVMDAGFGKWVGDVNPADGTVHWRAASTGITPFIYGLDADVNLRISSVGTPTRAIVYRLGPPRNPKDAAARLTQKFCEAGAAGQ